MWGRGTGLNPQLRRLVAAHVVAVVVEYAVVVAVLVDAYERGGAGATGVTSLAILLPYVVGAPLAAYLTGTARATTVRHAGLAVQALGYGLAAVAAASDAPAPLVVVGLGAVSTLRPSGAVLIPALARSSRQVTVANLRIAYCESAGALVGPLLAGGLLAVSGPPLALAGCAGCAAVALLVSVVGADEGPPAPHDPEAGRRVGEVLGRGLDVVRARPAIAGVLGLALARYVMLGALDIVLVVLALDVLGMAGSGAGVLNALVGVGAVASAGVLTVVAGRARLAPGLALGLGASIACCLALAAAPSLAVAVVALPVLGLGVTVIDGLGRMLLQRAAEPRQLGPLFSLLELVAGVGLVLGSGLALVLVAVDGARLALAGLAVVLLGLLVVAGRTAWRADETADLPVVEMSVLRALPMFAPLPPLPLEVLARSAVTVRVDAGETVVVQGEPGERFYAVVEGELDVEMSGVHVRTATRGGFFGEVALLADVPRTATVTARGPCVLLALDRVAFLVAVTGSDTSREAAWGVVRGLELDTEIPAPG